MKKMMLILVALICLLSACNSEQQLKTKKLTTEKITIVTDGNGHYTFTLGSWMSGSDYQTVQAADVAANEFVTAWEKTCARKSKSWVPIDR